MKKRLAIAISCILICIPSIGQCAPTVSAQIEGSLMTIFGNYLGLGPWATILVEAPDRSMQYIAAKEVNDGAFAASYDMGDSPEGTYHIVVKPAVGEKLYTSVEYTVTPGIMQEIPVSSGAAITMCAAAETIATFSDVQFTLIYDASKLQLTDLIGQYHGQQLLAGAYGMVTIISVKDGEIVFSINREVSADKPFTGTINLFQFVGKATGNAQVALELN